MSHHRQNHHADKRHDHPKQHHPEHHNSRNGALSLMSLIVAVGLGFVFKKQIMKYAFQLRDSEPVQRTVHKALKWVETPVKELAEPVHVI